MDPIPCWRIQKEVTRVKYALSFKDAAPILRFRLKSIHKIMRGFSGY